MPDIPDGEPNLLPKAALLAPLRVEFPVWEGAVTDPNDPGDTLYLYWDGEEVNSKLFTAADVIPANLFMTVPRARLIGDGEHQLQYVAYNSVGNPVGSAPAPVWIDTVEPGHNDVLLPLVAEPAVPADIVNEAYLAANGDQLLARVPAYVETRVGDLIQGFWQHELLADQDLADAQTVVDQQAIDTGEIVLVFSGQTIRQKGNGRARAWYRITDRAGNVSARSDDRLWLVDVQAPPATLRPPRIPQASDGLISRADACDTVMVVLDGYTTPAPGDQLLVTFNSSALAPVHAPGAGGFPVSVEVPWDILRSYGETASYRAVVYWQVQRGAFISPPSQTLAVEVDLRIAGPANPSPCPLNGRLPTVTVKGAAGDNLISDADAPGPVSVEVSLYGNPQEHDQLALYWGRLATPVATYDVQAIDFPGIIIVFKVRWADIEAEGAGANLVVHYTVSNGLNEQRSWGTECQVELGLEITGSRSQTGPFYHSGPSLLAVKSARSDVVYRWSYREGEQSALGDTFTDTHPESPLMVSWEKAGVVGARTTLRPVNICGIPSFSSYRSGCIVKNDGALFGWGGDSEINPPPDVQNVKCITCNRQAFAALHNDGTVTCWGDVNRGGLAPTGLTGVIQIVAAGSAFAALRDNGSLVTWGDAFRGGVIPPLIAPQLALIRQVVGGENAFAALRDDGEVFCWGGEQWPYGMTVAVARGSHRLSASDNAFAAVTLRKTAVAWGLSADGGEIPVELVSQLINVVAIASTSSAFAALTEQGRVLVWGDPRFGGQLSAPIEDARHLVGASTAFAALTTNGAVVGWGQGDEGGAVPTGLQASSIISGYGSMAACRLDGSVISWGVTSGEYTGTRARAVYAAGANFIVLTQDDELVSWGSDNLDLKSLDGLVSQVI
ncbi:RCC1 domain-containing protein [Pseudomonas sp. TE3610]